MYDASQNQFVAPLISFTISFEAWWIGKYYQFLSICAF